jgi:hypothetical protein
MRWSPTVCVAERGFEELVGRELRRLLDAIPAGDLAIQWDVCYEMLDLEGVLAWLPDGAWQRFARAVERLPRLIPEEVFLGFHLCYGTFPEWPMYEARDMGLIVRMANDAVANAGRTVDWLHLAGPRYLRSEDADFFQALSDLDVGNARVFLGIVLPWMASRAYADVTTPRRSSSTTSGWRCTADSAANRARTGWRRCASTDAWCARCRRAEPRELAAPNPGGEPVPLRGTVPFLQT